MPCLQTFPEKWAGALLFKFLEEQRSFPPWVEGQVIVTKVVANGILRTEQVHQKTRHFGSLLNILIGIFWSILTILVNF